MGIFDKITKKIPIIENSTKGFYFGSSEAEAENISGSGLVDYFEDYLSVLDQLEAGRFIFTGRKGVGKSAIAKYIHDTSGETEDSFAFIIRINDIDIERIIQSDSLEQINFSFIFEWLILVNMIKLIVKNNCTKYTKEYDKLKRFLDINSGVVNIDEFQFVEGKKHNGGEVKIAVLRHVFEGVLKKYFDAKVDKAPFFKLIPALKDILKIVLDYDANKVLEFWLLFDDLDINFNVNNQIDKNKIMELIRISKFYNNEIFRNNQAKVLLFLREDICDSIIPNFPDSSKIFSSYDINLNWYSQYLFSTGNECEIALKRLVNKRIELNFNNHKIQYSGDPWDYLFQPTCVPYYNGKTVFKYLLDFTFYRPRDIITFLSTMSNEDYQYPIDRETFKLMLRKYISNTVNEVKNELRLYFNESDIIIIFSEILPELSNNPSLTIASFKTMLTKYALSIDSESTFNHLVSYSILAYKDSYDNIYVSYRDKVAFEKLNKDYSYIALHKCIYHYFKGIS